MLRVQRRIGIAGEDRKEKADDSEEVLDELGLVFHEDPDRANVEGRADVEREVIKVEEAQRCGDEGGQGDPCETREDLLPSGLELAPPHEPRRELGCTVADGAG